MMFLAVIESASVAGTTRSSIQARDSGTRWELAYPPACAAAVATRASTARADSLAGVPGLAPLWGPGLPIGHVSGSRPCSSVFLTHPVTPAMPP